jgi:hypothetical protein
LARGIKFNQDTQFIGSIQVTGGINVTQVISASALQGSGSGGGGGTVDTTALVSQTTTTSHYYSHGSGSDANSGATILLPKATLTASYGLVPYYLKDNTCIHLSGTYTDFGTCGFSRVIAPGKICVIDGGEERITIVADQASNIHTINQVGVVAAGWTIDAYKGLVVQLTTGVCAGEERTIQGNSTSTLSASLNFSQDPGVPNFKIVRPATTLAASSVDSLFSIANGGNAGILVVQNLYLAGSKCQFKIDQSIGTSIITSVVCASTFSSDAAMLTYNSNDVRFIDSSVYNTSSFSLVSTANGNGAGVSLLGAPGAAQYFYVDKALYIEIGGSFFVGTYIYKVQNAIIRNGFRTNTMDMQQVLGSNINKNPSANYPSLIIDKSPGDGLILNVNTFCLMGDNIVIENNTLNGINVQYGAIANITGGATKLAGLGNGGWGAKTGILGNILVAVGATPTLTGTSGEASSFASGNTWASINGGTILLDANSKSLVRAG